MSGPQLYRSAVLPLAMVMFVALGSAKAFGQEQGDQKPIKVGLRKQLFVDDYVVAQKSNVTRELGRVTKANNGKPILVADKPWEKPLFLLIGSVFREGERLRMWYRVGEGLFGYAESEDGLHWTKPNLGIHDYNGSKENNIVDSRGFICFLDRHETDPAHKYKAAYCHEKVMAALARSPDGFHWTPYNDGQPVTGRAGDTMNQLLWDQHANVYRLYTRTDFGRGLYAGTLEEDRGTRDMTNPDVEADPTAWKTVRQWHFDREGRWEYKRRQIYALNGWIYEGIHFGLVWCHEWAGALGEGPYDLHKRHERDVMNYYILTTRGDQMWDLTWVYAEKPIVPRGPDGSFDKDWVQPSPNIVTWKDRHWLFYSGSKERHGMHTPEHSRECAIGLATLRLDGFVCLEAKGEPGAVVTKPFKLEGRGLEVNVDAAPGQIALEVLDEAGKVMPGFGQGEAKVFDGVDELRLQPRWMAHADLADLVGKNIRLRFNLRNAKLYAFRVIP